MVATALTDVGPLLAATDITSAALEEESVPYLLAPLTDGTGVWFVVKSEVAEKVTRSVYARVRENSRRSINGGIGGVRPMSGVAASLREAVSAAKVGQVEGHTLVPFSELGTFSLLLSVQSSEVLQSIAAGGLGVLEATTPRTVPVWWTRSKRSCTTMVNGSPLQRNWVFTGTRCVTAWTRLPS